jgi:hypothetical protein
MLVASIAAVALLMGAFEFARRSKQFARVAAFHQLEVKRHLAAAGGSMSAASSFRPRVGATKAHLDAKNHVPRDRIDAAYLADYTDTLQRAIETDLQVESTFAEAAWEARASAAHHERLARRYRRAARYPWLPIEADSPEPK